MSYCGREDTFSLVLKTETALCWLRVINIEEIIMAATLLLIQEEFSAMLQNLYYSFLVTLSESLLSLGLRSLTSRAQRLITLIISI